jgi:hypothetical protein
MCPLPSRYSDYNVVSMFHPSWNATCIAFLIILVIALIIIICEELHYVISPFPVTSFSWVKILLSHCSYCQLCDLVVRVPDYSSRGPGFDPRRYQIF